MEERLRYILENVNHWLKFAEGKNAALLVADTALSLGALQIVLSTIAVSSCVQRCFYGGIALLAVSAVLCLISFYARLGTQCLKKYHRRTSDKHNLLFFGTIAYENPSEFLSALRKSAGEEVNESTRLEQDYADQIVRNSKIALFKVRCFNYAVSLTATALIVLALIALFYSR